jgi:endonuclease/exonuclease/phosphatase family metal-dependent hydrolase
MPLRPIILPNIVIASRLNSTIWSLFLTCILIGWQIPAALAEQAIGPNEGLQRLSWNEADQVIGQLALIHGKVIHVGHSGKVNFINFDTDRPPAFTGIVFQKDLNKFPSSLEKMVLDKIVRIRGRVVTFKGKAQIVITDPKQIEILQQMPEKSEVTSGSRPLSADGELAFATYNVLNLFDDLDDPYHSDETTPAKQRQELERLADSLIALDADVVAMQEVESREYLQRFLQAFLPNKAYPHVVHFEGNDMRGIDVCLISRIPIGPVRSHRHLRFTGPDGVTRGFQRDLLAVTLLPADAEPIEAWVVHLKSKSGGQEQTEPIRLAEAEKIRALLDQALATNQDARILVMGDFNDTWESKSLQTIVGSGPRALWSVASELGEPLPDTYNRGEFHSMIDFMLCSPAMRQAYVKGSCRVEPGSVETTGSDHNPLVARFRVRAR